MTEKCRNRQFNSYDVFRETIWTRCLLYAPFPFFRSFHCMGMAFVFPILSRYWLATSLLTPQDTIRYCFLVDETNEEVPGNILYYIVLVSIMRVVNKPYIFKISSAGKILILFRLRVYAVFMLCCLCKGKMFSITRIHVITQPCVVSKSRDELFQWSMSRTPIYTPV